MPSDDFIPAKRLDYVVAHPPLQDVLALGRVEVVDSNGNIQQVKRIGGGSLYNPYYVVEGMKPRHVKALSRTSWDSLEEARSEIKSVLDRKTS